LAPELVHANHHSIELQWEHVRVQDKDRPEHRRLFDHSGLAHPGSLIYLHRREKKSGSIWESVYAYVRYSFFCFCFICFLSHIQIEDQR
jgi:hypothetical protein